MYTLFDPNQNGVKGTLQEIVPLLVKHGIDGIAIPKGLLDDPAAALDAGKYLRDHGIRWGLMSMPADFYAEDLSDDAFDAAIEKLKNWAGVAERAGVRYGYNHIWNGSNARDYDENFAWNVARVRRVAKVMNDHGIRYGLEFLGVETLRSSFRYPFLNTISGIFAIAAEAGFGCGFAFDTYHWYCGGANRGDVYWAAANVSNMAGFHMNDGVAGRSREQQQDMERALPMTSGVIDAALPYRAFADAGYAGPVMCEPMRPWGENREGRTLEESVAAIAASYVRVEEAAVKRA